MAISKEALAEIISGRAAQLCSEHANNAMDNMKSNTPNAQYFDGNYDFDSLYLTESSIQENNANGKDFTLSQKKAQNSKLPQAIIESMMTNHIDVSSTDPERSVLDTLGIPAKPQQKPQQQRQIIREQVLPNQTYSSNNGVDYSIIKAIVEECIDRKLNEHLNKQSLNESTNTTLKTIGLADGKIKLIDNKGNVFMSNLEYHGNIKDKKK